MQEAHCLSWANQTEVSSTHAAYLRIAQLQVGRRVNSEEPQRVAYGLSYSPVALISRSRCLLKETRRERGQRKKRESANGPKGLLEKFGYWSK